MGRESWIGLEGSFGTVLASQGAFHRLERENASREIYKGKGGKNP
jgi:hypothetical protein